MKLIGKPSTGEPYARFDEAGAGNLIRLRYCQLLNNFNLGIILNYLK